MGPSAGSGLLFNSTATTAGVVTNPISNRQALLGSIQTQSDGTQTVTVDIQGSLVPPLRDNYGATAPTRSDTYASTDWVTLYTATMASGAAISRIDTLAYDAFPWVRVRLTSGASTPAVKVWTFSTGFSN